jgi:ribonuclease-3 family protein
MLLDIFPVPQVNPIEMSTDSLAYLGDAVFNLYVKLHVLKDLKVRDLHRMSNKYVSREGQSKILNSIKDLLTEEESDIVRRGINSKGARKHGNDRLYMESTGFEALIGYLYLTNRKRLSFLLKEGIKWVEA